MDERKTPWPSIYACTFMLCLTGVQMSIYFMSTWQYLREVDSEATMEFFGWVAAACSLGCALANPIFGVWNQRTGSTKIPVSFGFTICALGTAQDVQYVCLPIADRRIQQQLMSKAGSKSIKRRVARNSHVTKGASRSSMNILTKLRKICNLLYAILPTLPSSIRWTMLIARFFTGFGADHSYDYIIFKGIDGADVLSKTLVYGTNSRILCIPTA
ncbi:hypothetical protein GCK32_015572 [Trichostrongylus colubriformis]|uniref:Uncharacterized protein n=1 Tax=Trichostrongylus colubriformis TaxID=6319 RepID=A0AAN8J2I4_TRICO